MVAKRQTDSSQPQSGWPGVPMKTCPEGTTEQDFPRPFGISGTSNIPALRGSLMREEEK